MALRLLAIDLEGALLRRDGSIASSDRTAIARARAQGVHVALLTQRIPSASLSTAQSLDLRTPMVCADGAFLVQPATGEILARRSVVGHATRHATAVLAEHGLGVFVLTSSSVHAQRGSEGHARWVSRWGRDLLWHLPSERATWPQLRDVASVLGIGTRAEIAAVLGPLGEGLPITVQVGVAPISTVDDVWSVRVHARSASKSSGLVAVAARLGVRRTDVALVGMDVHDLEGLTWAGRSYCLATAPELVRRRSSRVLTIGGDEGGAVAEALRTFPW